jgi:hypothetical protein
MDKFITEWKRQTLNAPRSEEEVEPGSAASATNSQRCDDERQPSAPRSNSNNPTETTVTINKSDLGEIYRL